MAIKMLVVDDHAEVRDFVRMALEQGTREALEAAIGEEALSIVRTQRPDCVIIDVRMPGRLDGFDVCATIKADAALRDTCVVLMTGACRPEDLEAGARAGADAYLLKPFNCDTLISTVGRLAANRRVHPD